MKKLSNTYYNFIFSLTMALIMSALMSFVVTSHNLGLIPELIEHWLKAWRLAFVVAFPTLLIVAPIVRLLTSKMVDGPK